MIYLLSGENQFQIWQKLNQIKADFLQKTGTDINIFIFEKEADFEKIKMAGMTENILSSGKLMIIKNFLKSHHLQLIKIFDWLKKIPPDSEIVFLETGKTSPQSRSLIKNFQKIGQVFQFENLTYSQAFNWTVKRAQNLGGQIDYQAAKTLVFFVGPDLQLIDNELRKLINFKSFAKILQTDVELLTKPQVSPKIFTLIDYIAAKNWSKSYHLLDQMLQFGENPLYLLSMIVYQFRNLILIKDLLAQNYSQTQITKQTKLHPFVVDKTISQVKNFDFLKLKKIYWKLLEADAALKMKTKNPELILNLLVVGLTR